MLIGWVEIIMISNHTPPPSPLMHHTSIKNSYEVWIFQILFFDRTTNNEIHPLHTQRRHGLQALRYELFTRGNLCRVRKTDVFFVGILIDLLTWYG